MSDVLKGFERFETRFDGDTPILKLKHVGKSYRFDLNAPCCEQFLFPKNNGKDEGTIVAALFYDADTKRIAIKLFSDGELSTEKNTVRISYNKVNGGRLAVKKFLDAFELFGVMEIGKKYTVESLDESVLIIQL